MFLKELCLYAVLTHPLIMKSWMLIQKNLSYHSLQKTWARKQSKIEKRRMGNKLMIVIHISTKIQIGWTLFRILTKIGINQNLKYLRNCNTLNKKINQLMIQIQVINHSSLLINKKILELLIHIQCNKCRTILNPTGIIY